MKQQELNDLIDKVNNGSATDDELRLYNHYLNQLTSGEEAWDVQNLGTEESVKKELQNRIELVRKSDRVKKVRLWPRVAGVSSRSKARTQRVWLASAAAVAVITLGVWLFYASGILGGRHPEPSLSSRASRDLNDIAPGKNTATLTLANGEVINLDTNKTSVVVTDSVKMVTMLTASTPRGGQYQVVLPDGTKVWLNADSRIEFASNFLDKNTRYLKLDGEAYFEVAKNKNRPFIVESGGTDGRPEQRVEVLGTHFNINAYKEEGGTQTTLLEGSVRVLSSRVSEGSVTLRPNQQAILTASNTIQVKAVDPNTALDWKNGEINLDNVDLKTAMRKIARWYDVEIVYEQEIPEERQTGGWVSRTEKLSAVLRAIENTGLAKFRIEGRRVYVTK